jgi:CubicO group peptidase (beta-lactamase class C family)
VEDIATQVVSEPFGELVDRVGREAEEGFFHTAAQLCVRVGDDTVLDVAVGRTHLHEPFRTDTLSALYCTAKPLVAVAVLALVADDELSLEDQLGHVVPALAGTWMAERTIEQVLGHTAGVHTMNTVLARVLPESFREGFLHAMEPPPAWRFGIDRSYAEFGGWFLLGQVIEEIAEQPYADFVTERVVEGYGIDPAQLVVRSPRPAPRPPVSGTLPSAATGPWRQWSGSTRDCSRIWPERSACCRQTCWPRQCGPACH